MADETRNDDRERGEEVPVEAERAPDAPSGEAVEVVAEPPVEELLAQKQAEVDALGKELLYLRAEFENFKRRTEKRYREALEYAAEPLLRELLPVLDNLERAVEHAVESGPAGHDALLEGLGHVIQQFRSVLGSHGVEPVAAAGERFDPGMHEAMAQVPGEENGRVGGVFEKGYTLKGRLLRPAKVAVTKVAPQGGDG